MCCADQRVSCCRPRRRHKCTSATGQHQPREGSKGPIVRIVFVVPCGVPQIVNCLRASCVDLVMIKIGAGAARKDVKSLVPLPLLIPCHFSSHAQYEHFPSFTRSVITATSVMLHGCFGPANKLIHSSILRNALRFSKCISHLFLVTIHLTCIIVQPHPTKTTANSETTLSYQPQPQPTTSSPPHSLGAPS